MKKLEKYNSTKTYMFPNGALGTPAVVSAQYPATSVFAHVVETDDSGEVMFALQNLSAMRINARRRQYAHRGRGNSGY